MFLITPMRRGGQKPAQPAPPVFIFYLVNKGYK